MRSSNHRFLNEKLLIKINFSYLNYLLKPFDLLNLSPNKLLFQPLENSAKMFPVISKLPNGNFVIPLKIFHHK